MKEKIKNIFSMKNITAIFASISILMIILIFIFVFWQGFQIFEDQPKVLDIEKTNETIENINAGYIPKNIEKEFAEKRISFENAKVTDKEGPPWKIKSTEATYIAREKENSINIYQKIGFSDIFNKEWSPARDPLSFGIIPLFIGSLAVTAVALLISIPVGIFGAIYVGEVASARIRSILKPIMEILAGVPSVIYGFFGFIYVAPKLQSMLNLPIGQNILTSGIILSAMVLPIIISVSEDAINSVPKKYKQGSLALGATRWRTLTSVTIPAAASGISASIILAFGRAIGETIAVSLTVGNVAQIPGSIIDPAFPMTSVIASEMGEAGPFTAHGHSLFFLGVLLFTTTFIVNLIARKISTRSLVEE